MLPSVKPAECYGSFVAAMLIFVTAFAAGYLFPTPEPAAQAAERHFCVYSWQQAASIARNFSPSVSEFEYRTPEGGTVICTEVCLQEGCPENTFSDKVNQGEVTGWLRNSE